MAKIYVTEGEGEEEIIIDEIFWIDLLGKEEGMSIDPDEEDKFLSTVRFQQGKYSSEFTVYREDLPKLKRAVDKAIELGWHEV